MKAYGTLGCSRYVRARQGQQVDQRRAVDLHLPSYLYLLIPEERARVIIIIFVPDGIVCRRQPFVAPVSLQLVPGDEGCSGINMPSGSVRIRRLHMMLHLPALPASSGMSSSIPCSDGKS